MLTDKMLLGIEEIFLQQESNSHEARQRTIKAIVQIANNELTETQKRVITVIYFENKTMTELAEDMGVCLSAVSRTHKRALERIRHYSRYLSLRS